ncbi:F-box domain, Leucine-rich repeat domain, L domain-like protein [Artemisia annua]|uniref:F-box domain, Leucine-rich repeat domain, L domain-like protein n=1 Tax=Artemisia annua TaxID=35608 RepID=A0A2U1KLY0_ARTAN|nr:F-box domain, Leucine-rich repeat domain, L domain-like protein [Artemisia annua]
MGFRHDAKRMNVEGDRLSSLPDDLIHKILSSISLQQAIETSSLSSRWRYIWTSMPYLDFSTEGFSKLNKFSKFVTNILSRRNNQVQLSSVKLSFRGKATQVFVKRILNYAFSHNVEQLTVVSFALKDDIPINLFSSQSLKHLMLTLLIILDDDDLFSHCPNLKNLTLNCCQTKICLSEKSGESEESHLNICHSKLSNLTLEDLSCYVVNVVNVEAPQIKNLIIRKCYVDVVNVEAPQLKNLIIRKGYSSVNLSADVLSLEKVDLTISYRLNAQAIVGLLQQFRSVRFLTLNLEIVECLSSSVELISHQPSPFATLKSLKIYPARKELHPKANVSTLVENYFLDSSPGVTLTMVLREVHAPYSMLVHICAATYLLL